MSSVSAFSRPVKIEMYSAGSVIDLSSLQLLRVREQTVRPHVQPLVIFHCWYYHDILHVTGYM